MRKLLLFAIIIASFVSIQAETIDKNTAYEKAVSFMQQRNPSIRFNNNKAHKITGKSVEKEQPYYVFNAENNQGFVIVAGNDLVEPIMGYADEGSFDYENIPPALQFMLDLYAEEIENIDEELTTEGISSPRKVVSIPRTSIKPFNPRRWFQTSPYYNMCPIDDGTRCSTGCLATAIAIAMGCFNWPEKTTAIPAYTTSTKGIYMKELEAWEIDWDNILDRYDYQFTSEQSDAVAKFMLYVAQGIKADFSKEAVNAFISSAIYALINYFDYDSNLYHVYSSDYDTVSDFADAVYAEISQGRPVVLDGFSLFTPTSNNAGHAFVCDGYDQDDLFHIDWGWRGYCNGYFRLTMLNPYRTTRNRNYSRNLGALFGFQPNGWKDNTGLTYAKEDMSLQFLSITPNDTGIRITLQNGYNSMQTYENAIGLYDNDLNLIKIISNVDTTAFNKFGWNYKTYSSISYDNVPDGIYKVIPISRISGEDTWHFNRSLGTYAYLEAHVNEGSVKYSPIETIVVNNFYVLESDKGNGIGAPQTAILNVTNNSFEKYDKYIYLVANKQLNMVHGLRIPMNSTDSIQFEFVPYIAGDYTLEVCKDNEGDFPIASTTTTVSDQIEYGNESKNYRILKAEILEDNATVDNGIGYVYTDKYKVTFNITNIDTVQTFNDYVRFSLSISTSTVSAWESTELRHIRLAPGETKTFTFESTEMTWTNKEYVFRVMTKWNTYASMDNVVDWAKRGTYQIISTPYTIGRAQGFRCWTADGNVSGEMKANDDSYVTPENAVAISFDNPDSSTWPTEITPNNNPNTLYYFNGESNYPNLGNVINEKRAKSIHFIDGYPTFVPESFTADSVSYVRTFDKGCNGRENIYNWSTIVLPFDVEKVSILPDSTNVDWFHNSEELEKDFWLCNYHGKENYSLLFDYSDEFLANTPYIIAVSDERIDAPGLVGKPILFSATNAEVKAGTLYIDVNDFDFEGNYMGGTVSGTHVFLLENENEGNNFTYVGDSASINPFRAYVSSDVSPNDYNKNLSIKLLHENMEMTGIENVLEVPKQASTYIYDMMGRKINGNKLSKGVYIINGKKVVVK